MPPAFSSIRVSGCVQVMSVMRNLQVEEQTPLTASEVYLFTWRGHLCFLPGLPWLALGRWHLPKQQMDALATCVRRVARLLWSVHVSFMDGFDEVQRPSQSTAVHAPFDPNGMWSYSIFKGGCRAVQITGMCGEAFINVEIEAFRCTTHIRLCVFKTPRPKSPKLHRQWLRGLC